MKFIKINEYYIQLNNILFFRLFPNYLEFELTEGLHITVGITGTGNYTHNVAEQRFNSIVAWIGVNLDITEV